jgi:hypothetical protein
MKGQACNLTIAGGLASTVILGFNFFWTHDHILLSEISDSLIWGARSPYLYLSGTLWPGYTPRHWGFLLSVTQGKLTL